MDKSSSLGMPMSPQEIFKGTSVKAWGCPKASPSSSTKYHVIFHCAILLLLHMLCVILGASLFLFLVFFCFVCCNQLGWILAFLCGRETHSAFSCEYSQSSLISVESSCLATTMLLALVFHASLVQSCQFSWVESTLLFHC